METTQAPTRIHPLMAGAAASVILVSLLGAAAIAGIIPNSHGNASDVARAAAQTAALAPSAAPLAQMTAPAPAAAPLQQAAPAVKEVVQHKTIVHHQYVQRPSPARARPIQVAQTEPVRQLASSPVYQQPQPIYQQPAPVAQNSPIGIGVGAVVGGLIGNQIGGGNGKTLATIAGVVGGGYVGNEIAKRN
jgi:uncharacterized protein YcfJ